MQNIPGNHDNKFQFIFINPDNRLDEIMMNYQKKMTGQIGDFLSFASDYEFEEMIKMMDKIFKDSPDILADEHPIKHNIDLLKSYMDRILLALIRTEFTNIGLWDSVFDIEQVEYELNKILDRAFSEIDPKTTSEFLASAKRLISTREEDEFSQLRRCFIPVFDKRLLELGYLDDQE